MMMNYGDFQSMMGDASWGIMPLMWLTYLLVLVVLSLSAIALWKYINKK